MSEWVAQQARSQQHKDAVTPSAQSGPMAATAQRSRYGALALAGPVFRLIGPGNEEPGEILRAAQAGVSTPADRMPFADQIGQAFGRHDIAGIQAHTGTQATASAAAMNARAFATGDHVVFGEAPDLHTAAHEAAHVVQQRGGVRPPGGIGQVGDAYERHADAVAGVVVSGQSAETLLDQFAGQGQGAQAGVQAIQRLTASNVMWDDYLDAYSARMALPKGTEVDQSWWSAYINLEAALYEAKAAGGGLHYDTDRVQDRYDKLAYMGFRPRLAGASPNSQAADTALTAANARFQAFRGDGAINRGGWAGSAQHGARPTDYAQTSAPVIGVMVGRQQRQGGRLGNWWLMRSDTAPSGWSLHRGAVDGRGDFIYHL